MRAIRRPIDRLVNRIAKKDFARIHRKMVNLSVELIKEKDLPQTLECFQEALDATWDAYSRSN